MRTATGNARLCGLLATLLLLLAAQPLQAYTDPGSGALLWQLIAGALVGGLFYINRLKSWILRAFSGTTQPSKADDSKH